jgi:D-glycero-D-manno-heptose 1,7-bisphosphate phosphatase
MNENRAVLLDRDGVLIEDVHLLTRSDQIRILKGVPAALKKLKFEGFKLIVVTNQPVVARGLVTEAEVGQINRELEQLLVQDGAPALDGWYFCPHHPQATLSTYRQDCECRKPEAGMFLQAACEHHLNLQKSFAVGDRITDIIAGAKAGCQTILVKTGKHLATPIQTMRAVDIETRPDYNCPDLTAAVNWILRS